MTKQKIQHQFNISGKNALKHINTIKGKNEGFLAKNVLILLKNGHFLRRIKTIKIAIFRWATTPW